MGGVREEVTAARRIVVKVGSSSLTTVSPEARRSGASAGSGAAGAAMGGLDAARVDALVEAIATHPAEIVLVSSGAIAAGLAPLGLPRRPRDLATQQAAARSEEHTSELQSPV